jgi:two-component system OmpR family sensor kinase
VLGSTALIVIFSIILYNYIKITLLDDLTNTLKSDAVVYIEQHKHKSTFSKNNNLLADYGLDKKSIIIDVNRKKDISFERYERENEKYLTIYYSYNKEQSSFLKIEKSIDGLEKLLKKILRSIFVISFLSLFLILAYAMFLSETLLYPVKSFTRKLTRMNEKFLEYIDIDTIPDEFVPLGESVNKLIGRIKNFMQHQKELFVGTAHELKTPLAVMKTKNEVTLIKDRPIDTYKDALRVNNKAIDGMNSMIASILEVGRQEGAQFEEPVEVDLVQFLKEKAKDYALLSKGESKNILVDIEPDRFCIVTQPALINHILQNFVQNAVKFTEPGKSITIKSRLDGNDFKIEVIDEGSGINENTNFFAPFKREGKKQGAGLGLFLAKGAADAIGADVSLKNRTDGIQGTVATVLINAVNYCPTDNAQEKKTVFKVFNRQ